MLSCFESIYRTAVRLTGNEVQAEDLMEETYLHAWRSLSARRRGAAVPTGDIRCEGSAKSR
jgi:DNA-directed RNA polymerase specialized sigma24 family protein